MSEIDLWIKTADANTFYEYLSAKEIKVLEDYLHDKFPLKEAAYELTKNYDLKLPYSPNFIRIPNCLTMIAFDVSASYEQTKLVNLMVAIRDLRQGIEKGHYSKHKMDLRKETNLVFVLPELHINIAEVQDCLWCEVMAPIRKDGPIRPECNIQWINLNAFLARLSSVNTCIVGVQRIQYLCESFIEDNDVRENPVIFNVAVSGAAQYMIYSAYEVLEFYEQNPTHFHGNLGWQKWKEGFREVQTNPLIDASGKKNAELAVAAMNEAELGWSRRHVPCEVNKAKHDGNCSEEIETKQGPACETKQSHDEAPLDSSV